MKKSFSLIVLITDCSSPWILMQLHSSGIFIRFNYAIIKVIWQFFSFPKFTWFFIYGVLCTQRPKFFMNYLCSAWYCLEGFALANFLTLFWDRACCIPSSLTNALCDFTCKISFIISRDTVCKECNRCIPHIHNCAVTEEDIMTKSETWHSIPPTNIIPAFLAISDFPASSMASWTFSFMESNLSLSTSDPLEASDSTAWNLVLKPDLICGNIEIYFDSPSKTQQEKELTVLSAVPLTVLTSPFLLGTSSSSLSTPCFLPYLVSHFPQTGWRNWAGGLVLSTSGTEGSNRVVA